MPSYVIEAMSECCC